MNNISIGPEDVVLVKGKYMYKADGKRFIVKGIAFPVPFDVDVVDIDGWIRVLHQLSALELKYNTVRLYSMDPSIDYSAFFHEAASLGIYIMVPLTSSKWYGVLNRDVAAPACYTEQLFQYGVASLNNFLRYPNVLAGVIGNEVVNSLESWIAAPCLKAYTRDLKLYMKHNFDRSLPLIYAAQHATFAGAAITASKSMRWMLDYLTCVVEPEDSNALSYTASESIDMFGVNEESWCSSYDKFRYNEQGADGSFYMLWNDLHDTNVPLIMTELGCPHYLYNRDNGLKTPDGTRDWMEVPVILHEMADTWSGFIAYAYDGNPLFRMFGNKKWNGVDTLPPSQDFFNFRNQLEFEETKGSTYDIETVADAHVLPRSCKDVELELLDTFELLKADVKLSTVQDCPSFASDLYVSQNSVETPPAFFAGVLPGIFVALCFIAFRILFLALRKSRTASPEEQKIMSALVNYDSTSSSSITD